MAERDNTVSEKEAIENAAIARFIEHLNKTRGVTYAQSGREVVINGAGTNYDFELTPDHATLPKMAVEIFRLFDSEGAAEQERKHGYYRAAMKRKLEAAGVGPYLVSVPHDVAPVARDAGGVASAHVQVIKNALDGLQGEAELHAGQFRIVQIPGLQGPVLGTLPYGGWVDPKSSQPQFEKNLAKKNSQLAVVDHERVVLVVNLARLVDPDDAVRVIATMDTSSLTNIDRVFFESRRGGFEVVYAREVRDSLATLVGPAVGEQASPLLTTMNLNDSCGYLSKSVVRGIASRPRVVLLRAGASLTRASIEDWV